MHNDLRQAFALRYNLTDQQGMVLCLVLVLINLLLLCALASWELVSIVTQVVRRVEMQAQCEDALSTIQHDVMQGNFNKNCQRNAVAVTTFYQAAPARVYSHMPCQQQSQQLQLGWQLTSLQSTTKYSPWRVFLLCYIPRYELSIRRIKHFNLLRGT